MEPAGQQSLDSLSLDDFCELARDPNQASRLQEYLGSEHYRELSEILRGAPRLASRAAQGTVVLLHGIMGSQIGKARRREWDIVWLNPLAIRDGNMALLKVGSGPSRYGARGLIPMFYSLLWSRLKFRYGYKVVEFAYDWRLGVAESSKALVQFIDEETSGPVSLVAHSMGGLVARAALPSLGDRVQRVIQLAAPNYGSFSPVVTLRGQNEFVNRILALDGSESPADLISDVVGTFRGLYELMPAPARFSTVNLFDASLWPASPRVAGETLAKAKSAIESLPPSDPRIMLIAGTNQDTVTEMSRDSATGEFRFGMTKSGDGTVPLDFARFDPAAKVPTYLANVTHNGILLDGAVAAAIDELLRTGKTGRLPLDSPGESRTREASRPLDTRRAPDPFQGRRGENISSSEMRQAQREVLGPLQPAGSGRSGPGGTGGMSGESGAGGDRIDQGFKGVVVSRRRRRLRLILAHGDITRVSAHAHVLGVFEGVTPTGPATAYNELLGGAVNDLFARRMFSGARGSVYILPTYKTPVPSELLVIAGLGSFPEFGKEAVEDVARQLMQSLLRVRANELATVVFGGSFDDVSRYLRSLLQGFIAGLEEADHGYDFQRIVLCELDPGKYRMLQDELYRLASSPLFDNVEVEFDTVDVSGGPGAVRGFTDMAPPPLEQPVYLISNLLVVPDGNGGETRYRHEISVLPPSSGTTFSRLDREFPKRELDKFLREVQNGAPRDLDDFGDRLAAVVLPEELATRYQKFLSQHSVQLLHDAMASRIPWEAVRFGDVSPAVAKGFSRKYQRNRSAVMVSETQRRNGTLKVLLVYNPTKDLDGAEKEGKRILATTADSGGAMVVVSLHGDEATRDAIVNRLAEDSIDVLHYAGHAGYVAENPSQSGLLCANEEILSGRELEPLGARLPPVIVLNACESGRLRRGRAAGGDIESTPASAAEAILNAGIMCLLATYWPVSDGGAGIFAAEFYNRLLAGMKPGAEPVRMGDAVLVARQALQKADENDWANYMLYGNPDFVLKQS